MLRTIVHTLNITDTNERKYLIQSIDDQDILKLSPETNVELLSMEEIELYDERTYANFKVTNGELILETPVPENSLPLNNITYFQHNSDDLWHFLHLLGNSNAKLLISKSDYQVEEGYSDTEKTYLTTPRSMIYSTSHANCSIYQLVDGLYTDPDSGEVTTTSRWTSIKIVENNKLNKETLIFICDKETLGKLQQYSSISLTVLPYTTMCNTYFGAEMSKDISKEEIYYCIAYLSSVPIIRLNKQLITNTPYNILNVERFNTTSMYLKAIRAVKSYLISCNPQVLEELYGGQEDIYKPKQIRYSKEKTKGIKFSLAGNVALPSLNVCVRALKDPSLATFDDIMNLTTPEIDALNLNGLKEIHKDTILFGINMVKECRNTDNPIASLNSLTELDVLYTDQRELYKKRLNLLRSMLLINLPETIYEQGSKFQTPHKDQILNIQAGIY